MKVQKRAATAADKTRGRELQRGMRERRCRARRCKSRRVSVPRGLCKRLGSVSDPRAVPEKRSPESRSTSEVKIQLRAAAIAREVKVQQTEAIARKVKMQQRAAAL